MVQGNDISKQATNAFPGPAAAMLVGAAYVPQTRGFGSRGGALRFALAPGYHIARLWRS
jgi:hypothetical protein